MSGIVGDLCTTAEELKRTSRRRKKRVYEESVPHAQVDEYKRKGWEVARVNKARTVMKKPKGPEVLFEDHVWTMFYDLGLSHMNKDRNCQLELGPYKKQIDVLARDKENVFVVDCAWSGKPGPVNARSKLEEYAGKYKEIGKALRAAWGDCGRINVVVAVSSQEKRKADEEYVRQRQNGRENLLLWTAKEIEYIKALTEQVGLAAKHQVYSVIFSGKRQKSLAKEYVALKGKMGGRVVYSFLISAKSLLNYAYVHHRKLTGIVEAAQAYQRMLRSAKLRQIRAFIDDEDGYFPNSVIVNFSKRLQWKQKQTVGDIAMGVVTLPGRYGCAWVIDGQHRLYGAATATTDIVVPVLAFEDMDEIEQANLFVEINEKQKKVPSDLLWDLYSDIYCDSSDKKQRTLYQVAETAKRMESYGPLKGVIDIPSLLKDRPVKLKLTGVCVSIEKYGPWSHLKHPTDDERTPDNAARLTNAYFNELKTLWPEDWARGNSGVMLSNSGFGVFTMVFNDIVKHIAYKDDSLLQPSRTNEFAETVRETYLRPMLEYLKTDEKLQKDIRTLSPRGPQSDNAGVLDLKIQEFVPDFSPARIGGIPDVPPHKEPPAVTTIQQKASAAEAHLRDFVSERLKRLHGDAKWWKLGIPGDKKADADKIWAKEVKRKPYLQREKDQNERKFQYLGLGGLMAVITSKQNWDGVFQQVFADKSQLERRIVDIMALRNPTTHTRKTDDQDVVDGTSGLLWLSNCMSCPDLNPYA